MLFVDHSTAVYVSLIIVLVFAEIAFQTTTSCYYATLHLEATKVLADVVNQLGKHIPL